MWRQIRKKRHLNSDTSIQKPHKYLWNYVVTDWFQVRGKLFLCIEVVNFIINWMTYFFTLAVSFQRLQQNRIFPSVEELFLSFLAPWSCGERLWENLAPISYILRSITTFLQRKKKYSSIHRMNEFLRISVKSASLQHSQVNISPGESFLRVKQQAFSPGCLQVCCANKRVLLGPSHTEVIGHKKKVYFWKHLRQNVEM